MYRVNYQSMDHGGLIRALYRAQVFPQESNEEIGGKGGFENPEKSSEFSIGKCSKTNNSE